MSDIYRDSIFWVEVERIKPNPYQPRREFDQSKLEELADSIRMYGLLQPLTVTRKENARGDGGIEVEYELIAGERRLRASKIAGLQQLPVIIRSGEDTDQMKLELAIIENLQREDLNPVDRARAFEKLFKEFGFTQSQIGKKVGKSREYVTNTLRILMLPEFILTYVAEGRISEGHTRPLMMLNDKPEEQSVLIKEILLKKLTVRESEAIARRSAQDRVSARHKIDPEIISMERALTERLGTRVTIEPREVGGRLVISFFSAQDLQTLLDAIRVEDERSVATQVFDGLNTPTEVVVADEDDMVGEYPAPIGDAVPRPSFGAQVDSVAPNVTSNEEQEYVPTQTASPDSQPFSTVRGMGMADEARETPISQAEVFDAVLHTSSSVPLQDDVRVEETTGQAASEEVIRDDILGTFMRAPSSEPAAEEDFSHETISPLDSIISQEIPQTPQEDVRVIPSADRPLPEEESRAQSDVEKKSADEDDTDLYSIKHFSI